MKIALVGSAPSSAGLAPYDDPSWLIWGCSPGSVPYLKRVDAFFEIHRWLPGENGFTPGFIEYLAGLTCPVFMIEPRPEVPCSVSYPKDAMLERWPGAPFTSSLAWMLAAAIDAIEKRRLAILEGPADVPYEELADDCTGHEIGLWGVDMAATDEYHLQKPGCHYFIEKARERGITVTIPPESCLGRPLPLYGLGEANPMRIKLTARKKELEARYQSLGAECADLNRRYEDKLREQHFVAGALDDLTYMMNTWCE